MGNGGPAPESITNKIYENTTQIKEYFTVDLPEVLLTWVQVCYIAILSSPLNYFIFVFSTYGNDRASYVSAQVDITKPGITSFEVEGGTFTVDVFDSASDYVKLLK